MTLVCTYPGDDYPRLFPIIKAAAAQALVTGASAFTLSGGWTAGSPCRWVTTVSGLTEIEESAFVVIVSGHCAVTRA